MKKILKSLLAAGVLFAVVGCEKDQIGATFTGEGEDALTAYFSQKTVAEEFDAAASGDQIISVDIYRQSAEAELTVGLDYEIADGGETFFEIPENVTFKAGEYHTTVPVKVCGVENFAKGVNYEVTLSVGDFHEFVSVSSLDHVAAGLPVKNAAKTRAVSIAQKYGSVKVSTTLTLEWEPCYILSDPTKLLSNDLTEADYVKGSDGKPMKQTAVYTYDDVLMSGEDDEIVLERAKGTTVFRMCNWGGGVNIIFTVNPDKKVIVDGNEYMVCTVTEQYIGIEMDGYGKFYVTDAEHFMYGDAPYGSYEDFPCLWDGERDFVFHFVYSCEEGIFFKPEAFGVETLTLDSGVAKIEDPEPTVAISYEGVSETVTGVKSHTLNFAPNADAAKYYATIIKTDADLVNKCNTALTAYLTANGLSPQTPQWNSYYKQLYPDFFEETYAGYGEELYESFGKDITDKNYAKFDAGNGFPVFKFTEASSEVWDLGATGGVFTAVAVSYDKNGEVHHVDVHTFVYDPDGSATDMGYACDFEPYANPGMGYFKYNSLYFGLQSESRGDIVDVTYALLTKAAFDEAALADDAAIAAYLDENGKSLSAANLEDANDSTPDFGGFGTWLAAEPATEYKLLLAVSNPDATKIEVLDATTEAAVEPTKLTVETFLQEVAEKKIYEHTHLWAQFGASGVTDGYYMMATPKQLAKYVKVDKDNHVSLCADVKEADLYELIKANGSAFTNDETGPSDDYSDLYCMNATSDAAMQISFNGKPATEYVVLAYAVYSDGSQSWAAGVQKTDFAPTALFTQTVSVDGKNIGFNWSATPTASIFKVSAVEYALVPQSALTAAGVDLSKLTDEQLNAFEARIAAGGDKAAIEAEAVNAEKVLGVLAESVKVFQGDAAAAINNAGGVSKQFQNVAAGDYALIAVAYDTYGAKLTVGLVSVQ